MVNPGEIYEVHGRGGKTRPVVVVSREALNRGDYVVVVPFTSQKFEARKLLPNCVPFRAGESRFDRDCVAQAEALSQIPITALVGEVPSFTLDDEALAKIVRAVGNVISCRCELVRSAL
jgi:mRNA-degrading endonuclease toxin of MazEF toxin-antitoxin module